MVRVTAKQEDMNTQNTVIDTTEEHITMSPAFNQNNIPIILACDNNYAPYGAITINSIIQNATPENNYDIILLHTEITQENQDRIYQLAKGKNNISVKKSL